MTNLNNSDSAGPLKAEDLRDWQENQGRGEVEQFPDFSRRSTWYWAIALVALACAASAIFPVPFGG